MYTAMNKSELELSRLSERRTVSKILQDERFRHGLENMVLTYKLSMTETTLSHRSPEQTNPPPSLPPVSIQKRGQKRSEMIGDVTQYMHYSSELRLVTLKLTVTCRLIEHFGWYQPTLVHCSARTESGQLVFTPLSTLFSQTKATELLVLSPGTVVPEREVDRSTLSLHEHLLTENIHCVVTVNTPMCAAIASLRYGLLPLSRDYLQLGEVEYAEASQLTYFKPEGRVVFFRNQGLCVVGSSVEEAFYHLYHVLTACSVQTIALAAGTDKVLPMRPDLQYVTTPDRDTHHQEEAYQAYFENLARLITDTPLSKVAAVANDSRQGQDALDTSIHTNPFLPITPNSNPFLPLPSDSNLPSFYWHPKCTETGNLWDFTHSLYPSEDIWSFLAHFSSGSNPLTHNAYTTAKRSGRTQIISNKRAHLEVYDDLV